MNARRSNRGQLLKVGQPAPEFVLPDQDGNVVTLTALRGKRHIVLVFYPGDKLPLCTKQLCGFRDNMGPLADADIAVFGINPCDAASHREFARKHALSFPLLVDADEQVTRGYGCKGLLMTKRTVYAIDKDGIIVFAARGMPSPQDVLKALQQ